MQEYLDMLKHVLDNGQDIIPEGERTGTGTRKVFGYQTRFDLSKGFPLLTTKKMFWKGILKELLWFLSGDTNVKSLIDQNVHIWDGDAYRGYVTQVGKANAMSMEEYVEKIKTDEVFAKEHGELGPVYGKQWRDFRGVDQIKDVVERIKTKPFDRRLIVSAWNPADLNKMVLPPCHLLFQFNVSPDKRLSCNMYQRSCDLFLGVPFNIASYSIFTMMMAQVTGLKPGEFVHTFGDLHLYRNHLNVAREQLTREPNPLPSMWINPEVKNILDFKVEDFKLENYESHPPLKAQLNFGL